MKKKASICLLLIIIVNVLMANLVHGATTNPFSVTSAKGKKGDEVTVVISLDKELEFAAADLTLEYDPTKLEYVKYTELELFEASAMNITKNNSDNGKIAIGYVSNPDTATEKKNPGKMVSITFKIKSGANENTNLVLKCTTLKTDSGESVPTSNAYAVITIENGSGGSSNNNNNNGSNTGSGGSTNNNNNNNSGTGGKSNQSNSPLPYTGTNAKQIIFLFFIVIGLNLYLYRKYIEYKDI